MPQQIFKINEGLKSGLRSSAYNPRNTQLFTTFKNMLCEEHGARVYTLLEDNSATKTLLGSGDAHDQPLFAWPWPQIFRGKALILECMNQAIYTITYDGTDWEGNFVTDNEMTLKKALAVGDTFTIPSASGEEGIWHFVDFHDVWGLVRPNCTLFYSKVRETATGSSDVIMGQGSSDATYVTMRSATAFKGRAISGGFDSSHFWSSDWKYIWRTWANQQHIGVNFDFTDVDSNWIMWSGIGGGDLLWVFKAEYAYNPSGVVTGTLSQTSPAEPQLFQSMMRGDFGFMPMPWEGNVEIIKPLGDVCMVYGDNGITATKFHNEPIPTLGIVKVFDQMGVMGRGAVGGDERVHLIMDREGRLWLLGPDLQPKKLGYEEIFSSGWGNVIINYDPYEQRFYIGNATETYILTKTGLCSTHQKITSVFHEQQHTHAAVSNPSGDSDNDVTLTTDAIDFGSRAVKTIQGVDINAVLATGGVLTVAIDYRYTNVASWSTSTALTLSNEGHAPCAVSGVEFRLKISSTDHTKITTIDYIDIMWSLSDRRTIRGMHSYD